MQVVRSSSHSALHGLSILLIAVLCLGTMRTGSFASSDAEAQELTPVSVALDWYPNANHAGLFLAQERGYFAQAGLAVEFYTPADPSTVLQTVGAGRDTFGISYQPDVLLARAQGVPVVSVAALVQRPLLGIMSLASAGIARPHDLVGKAVGYPGIPYQEAFLATMLETDSAGLDQVELVNVGFDLLPAVLSGRTDAVMGAYWTHETILAERQGHPVNMLRVEEWGVPNYYELVMTSSERVLAEQPETVRAFLRAMQRGYQDAIDAPQAALDTLIKASPDLAVEVEREGIRLLTSAWTDNGSVPFGTQTGEHWATFATWMRTQGLIPDDLNVEAAYETTLLPTSSATPVASPASLVGTGE